MGLAYLPDGRRMDYEEYLRTPEWRMKKLHRLAFDNWQCGFCHETLYEAKYETHHINYGNLGNEDITKDLITLCPDCHAGFHSLWSKQQYWDNSPLDHWKHYSLEHEAQFCIDFLQEDYFFGGKENMCRTETIDKFIDKYYESNDAEGSRICETDIKLFVRNRRYDLYLESISQGKNLEDWLDEKFGKKGVPGGNKTRAAARSFCTKHPVPAIKRFYKENENIIILMKEVKNKLEENNNG